MVLRISSSSSGLCATKGGKCTTSPAAAAVPAPGVYTWHRKSSGNHSNFTKKNLRPQGNSNKIKLSTEIPHKINISEDKFRNWFAQGTLKGNNNSRAHFITWYNGQLCASIIYFSSNVLWTNIKFIFPDKGGQVS